MRIDQLIPAYHKGDAIGDTASHLRDFLNSRGFSSQIYCLTRDEELGSESLPFDSFPEPAPSDITILHFALPSLMTRAFAELKSKKVLIYHNITPPKFFLEVSPEMARICERGKEELLSLKPHVSIALADSEFNRLELEELGFRKTAVFPLFIDFKKYEKPWNPLLFELFRDGRLNVLFVGRVAPNKKIEDLIKVIFYYKKYISPLVRLIVVGKTSSFPVYYRSLIKLADEFYLNSEEICFTGHISDEEMFAIYRASDIFLSLSEHEGFGLPFLESMIFDLPIIAYECTAVPYTLEGAGVLLKEKRVEYTAELLQFIAHNPKLKEEVLNTQRQRLKKFKEEVLGDVLLKSLEEFLSEG